jgi:hypothetical protein
MTAHALPRPKVRRKPGGFLVAFVILMVLAAGGVGAFVAYLLWPTWPSAPIVADEPPIPITVAGVLFNIPPAAIRSKVLRHPGTHERVDLAFLWPSLVPPPADAKTEKPVPKAEQDGAAPSPNALDRLFVTIAPLGAVLTPAERLRGISSLRGGAGDRRPRRARVPAVPDRHALSGRGLGLSRRAA